MAKGTLIKPIRRVEDEVVNLRLEKPAIALLDEYAKYLDSPRTYVLNRMIETVAAMDKQFQESRNGKQAKQAKA